MELMKKAGMPGDAFVGPLGDWLAPEETDNHLIWNAFYGRDAQLMQRFAELLGHREEAETFAAIAAETKKYWNETFVDTSTGKTKKSDGTFNDTQCSYALGLSYEMFDQDNRRKAFDHLARKTKEVGYTVSTGFFGTGPLNPMLSEGGYDELAYALITQTAFPSWLYPVTQGATTIWERWDSYTVERGFGGQNAMNSFNHYSLGSVLSWMYEYVLGIQRDEKTPGYKHFVLKPSFTGFQFAEGGFETPHGRIESYYVIKDGSIEYSCRIPANTTSTLKLKDKEYELGSGSYQYVLEA
jgi:alpha-L-rhamnosidase